MTEASRLQKMIDDQNAWIHRLNVQVMQQGFEIVGYRTRNKQLEAALAHIYAWYPISVSKPTQTIHEIRDYARKALEGKDE